MKKVIVHIGLHKTGTSSIQAALYQNRNELSRRGVLYRCFDDVWPNHHPIAVNWTYDFKSEKVREFLEETIADPHHQTILLSSEMFAERNFDVEQFLSLMQNCNVMVLAYLRNPCHQLVSAFGEVVRDSKLRWTESISSNVRPYDVSYFSLLGRWLLNEDVVLCPYDPAQWYENSLIKDFLAMTGVFPDGFEINSVNENVGLPFEFVEILRELNKSGVDGKTWATILQLLGKIKPQAPTHREFPLSEMECDKIIASLRARFQQYEPYLREGFDRDFLFVNPAVADF